MAASGLPGADRRQRIARSPETVDRALVGVCGAIWLLVLGMAVAATVALVDSAAAIPRVTTGSSTPWLLYSVIAVSALVIVGAIPLLLRARRTALGETGGRQRTAAASPAPTPVARRRPRRSCAIRSA